MFDEILINDGKKESEANAALHGKRQLTSVFQ
jgi:hypothetical protein